MRAGSGPKPGSKVASNMIFLKGSLDTLAEYITKDEDVLGDVENMKKSVLDTAVTVLNLEHTNTIVQQHIEMAVSQARQTRRDHAEVEQERRRFEEMERLDNANENGRVNGNGDGTAQVADGEKFVSKKRQLEVNAAESAKKMIAEVNAAVKRDMGKFNAQQTTYLRELKERLVPEQMGDDDVMVHNTGPSEKDFVCPYTAVRFVTPMRNTNANAQRKCTHRLDISALNQVFKKKNEIGCVVGGCRGVWVKNMYEEDEAFKKKMERFDAVKGHTQKNSSSSAVDVDDEYTAI